MSDNFRIRSNNVSLRRSLLIVFRSKSILFGQFICFLSTIQFQQTDLKRFSRNFCFLGDVERFIDRDTLFVVMNGFWVLGLLF
jgi:endonuclease YncB( thermonuclease family)